MKYLLAYPQCLEKNLRNLSSAFCTFFLRNIHEYSLVKNCKNHLEIFSLLFLSTLRIGLLALLTIFIPLSFAAQIEPGTVNPHLVRIVPVEPTPEPDNVITRIIFPTPGDVTYNAQTQIRLEGFPIGTQSDFDRRHEVYDDPNGQSLLVFVDNFHPIEIYTSLIDPLDEYNLYYKLTLTTSIPFYLGEGMHVIRALPARSYGESLKNPKAYDARVFYIGAPINNLNVDLNGPYLTYNEPLETLIYPVNHPILLDFFISNVQLSRDGFKVRVTINDVIDRTLSVWVPYYIYGLPRGQHKIRLQLIDEMNTTVPGLFNDVTRLITVD